MSLIETYLKSGKPSPHTILCLVGMIETGEITWDQLQMEAGDDITEKVRNEWRKYHNEGAAQ